VNTTTAAPVYKKREVADKYNQLTLHLKGTVALAGQVGEYVALGRRKGDTWYVGALSNWTARDLPLDCSFLGPGT
jgi:alpha-glucosidase